MWVTAIIASTPFAFNFSTCVRASSVGEVNFMSFKLPVSSSNFADIGVLKPIIPNLTPSFSMMVVASI